MIGLEAIRCRDTILVLDDDPEVRNSLRALLEAHGFGVLDFSNGIDFLAAYRPGLGRCLLLDIEMPEMDGRAVLARLATRPISDLSVILIAGADIGILEGSCRFLRKPIRPLDVITAIESVLSA